MPCIINGNDAKVTVGGSTVFVVAAHASGSGAVDAVCCVFAIPDTPQTRDACVIEQPRVAAVTYAPISAPRVAHMWPPSRVVSA